MKKNWSKYTLFLCCLFFLTTINVLSQTSEQVRQYHNKTNIAIYKCQNELFKNQVSDYDAEYKAILTLQLDAQHYFTANDN